MPYDPHQQYVGGELLYRGFHDLGEHLADAFNRYEKHAQAMGQFDAAREILANTQGPDGKPWLDPKMNERMMHFSAQQKSGIGGGILNILDITSRMAARDQRVPYTAGGTTYNIRPSEAAQLAQTAEAQKAAREERAAGRTEVTVGEKTIPNVPVSTAAQIEAGKQPKGPTYYQTWEMQQKAREQLDKKVAAQPETKFSQQYKLQPRQVLQPNIADPTQHGYRLFSGGDVNQEVQPEYDQFGVPRVPNTVKQDPAKPPYWTPTTDVFRERKIESNVKGVKQTNYYADPSGELLNIGGQRIPFSEVQAIKNRHDELLTQAQAAIKAGKDPGGVLDYWNRLGYDPKELQ
jgi:hypothetical protein